MIRMRYLMIGAIVLLTGCTGNGSSQNAGTPQPAAAVNLPEKDELFAWRESRYDTALKDTFSTIIVNDTLCRKITDMEKAALGYVATFVGSECDWDGGANASFSNLKCKINAALGLGYQCSDQHLGFLRKWFRQDTAVLARLTDCPTVPYTASSQETFDRIRFIVKNNTIKVVSSVSGMSMRTGDSWHYDEEDVFVPANGQLRLEKTSRSRLTREHIENAAGQ